jgi:hypothetical protein
LTQVGEAETILNPRTAGRGPLDMKKSVGQRETEDPGVEFRTLGRTELSRVDEIDRSERINVLYGQHGTQLVARHGNWSVLAASACALCTMAPRSIGSLRLAGIGNVASDPSVCRQGYIRRRLSLAHDRARAAGYDLAMLFTDVPYVYAGGAAFEALPFWWLDLPLGGVARPESDWRIAPLDTSRQLGEVREVHEAFRRERPGYPLREDRPDRAVYWMSDGF